MKLQSPRTFLCLFSAALAVSTVRADDISDAIDGAKSAYSSDSYSEAIQQADYAATLIRQKKSDLVAKLLPAAPSGFTAGEIETQGNGAAMFGGMVGAKRSYEKGEGDERSQLSIEIQSDSPLMQSLLAAFSIGGFGQKNVKSETHKGEKLNVEYPTGEARADSSKVSAVIDNRYAVTITGSKVSRDELVKFAKSFDYAALKAIK